MNGFNFQLSVPIGSTLLNSDVFTSSEIILWSIYESFQVNAFNEKHEGNDNDNTVFKKYAPANASTSTTEEAVKFYSEL